MVKLSDIWQKGTPWDHEKAKQWCVDRGFDEYSELTQEAMAYIERLEEALENIIKRIELMQSCEHRETGYRVIDRLEEVKKFCHIQQAALQGKES